MRKESLYHRPHEPYHCYNQENLSVNFCDLPIKFDEINIITSKESLSTLVSTSESGFEDGPIVEMSPSPSLAGFTPPSSSSSSSSSSSHYECRGSSQNETTDPAVTRHHTHGGQVVVGEEAKFCLDRRRLFSVYDDPYCAVTCYGCIFISEYYATSMHMHNQPRFSNFDERSYKCIRLKDITALYHCKPSCSMPLDVWRPWASSTNGIWWAADPFRNSADSEVENVVIRCSETALFVGFSVVNFESFYSATEICGLPLSCSIHSVLPTLGATERIKYIDEDDDCSYTCGNDGSHTIELSANVTKKVNQSVNDGSAADQSWITSTSASVDVECDFDDGTVIDQLSAETELISNSGAARHSAINNSNRRSQTNTRRKLSFHQLKRIKKLILSLSVHRREHSS